MKERTVRHLLSIVLLLCIIAGTSTASSNPELDSVAEAYVKLVLKVGLYDTTYIDYYYGPEEWNIPSTDSTKAQYPLDQLAEESGALVRRLESLTGDNDLLIRERFLKAQLKSVKAYIGILNGLELSFDDEALALFGIAAPRKSFADFDEVLDVLDSLLPGRGDVGPRLEAYESQFIVANDKVPEVYNTVLAKVREITKEHANLPEGEEVTVKFVYDKPWGGYCTFLGEAHSLVQMNLDTPRKILAVMDLATHEAYPGHHTNYTLCEQNLVDDSGWIELTVCPLFSPWSVLAEGLAMYAIDMALPMPQRMEYASEVLFPMAGLDSAGAAQYFEIEETKNRLWEIEIGIARDYVEGTINAATTVHLLKKYLGLTDEAAAGYLGFYDFGRSYIITYYVGYDLVRHYMETVVADPKDPAQRWAAFKYLLSAPLTPSELKSSNRQSK